MYCDLPGNYFWGTKFDGNVQIATGGAEKNRFIFHLSCFNSGKKFIPIIIFKGAPLTEQSRRNSIAVEHREQLPDNSGDQQPQEEKVYLDSTNSASLSGKATVNDLRDVILPVINIQDGESFGVLVDYFKGHSRDFLKSISRSFLSGYDRTPVGKSYKLCEWCIMDGRITCEKKTIYKFTGKFFKGNYRGKYDLYMLTDPENTRGYPQAPYRQLCATWLVKEWLNILVELVRKAWKCCRYKSMEELPKSKDILTLFLTLSAVTYEMKFCKQLQGQCCGEF